MSDHDDQENTSDEVAWVFDDEALDGEALGSALVVDWWTLSPADRLAELDELRLFVGRVVATYLWDASIVPGCWERHEGAIRLLDSLRRAYVATTLPGQGGDVMVSWHRSAAFVRGELKEFFHGLPCQDSHTETVSRSAVQPWAADIATDGKMSSAWRKGRNLAWQDYQNTMADNW